LSQDGKAWVYGKALVFGEAEVFGEASVFGEARVYGKAEVYGKALVFGEVEVFGEASVFGEARVLQGFITASIKNINISLKSQLGVSFIKNKVILYKRVNKISERKYASCYDSNFIYEDGKIVTVKNPDLSNNSCSTGIHLSTSSYWNQGDTLIACEVNKDDVITIQQGKVRCKKCKVIGEINESY